MYNHKFQYDNNRIRIVGLLLSEPEKYYVSPQGNQYYCFFVQTTNKWHRQTIVPVATKNNRCENLNIKKLLGKKVVVYGSANSRANVQMDEFGNKKHTFEQFIKLEDIREATKEYDFDNIGAIQGSVVKKIDRTLRSSGRPCKSIIVRVEQGFYQANLEVFTQHLFDRFDQIEPGEKIGFKYRFVNTSNMYINSKLEAAEIYKGNHILENPYFQALIFHREENLNLDR